MRISDWSSDVCSSDLLCQDKSGFLWIGTRGGLNRYDGYEFKLIRNPPESGNNFTSQYIEVIHEGTNNVLWIGTKTTGLNAYDMLRDTICHQIPPDSLQINIQNIQALPESGGQPFIEIGRAHVRTPVT